MLPVNTALETMIEHAISTLDGKSFPGKVRFLFVTRDASPEQAVAAELARVAAKHGFEYDTHNLDILTEGPASTVYEAKHLMDPEAQLIISNSDRRKHGMPPGLPTRMCPAIGALCTASLRCSAGHLLLGMGPG